MACASHDLVAVSKHEEQREDDDEQIYKECEQILHQPRKTRCQKRRNPLCALTERLREIRVLPGLRKLVPYPGHCMRAQCLVRIRQCTLQLRRSVDGLPRRVYEDHQ